MECSGSDWINEAISTYTHNMKTWIYSNLSTTTPARISYNIVVWFPFICEEWEEEISVDVWLQSFADFIF